MLFLNGAEADWNIQTRADLSDTRALSFTNGGNTQVLVIQQNGNVGIGTTSPGAKLHVSGEGVFDQKVKVRRASNIEFPSTLTNYEAILNNDTEARLLLMRYDGQIVGADALGQIDFGGYDSTLNEGTEERVTARIEAISKI